MKFRLLFWLVPLLVGFAMLVQLFRGQVNTPLDASLAPAFSLIGKTTRSADAVLGKMLPVDDLDEKELGDAFAEKFASRKNRAIREEKYLNKLVNDLSIFKRKNFNYRVFVLKTRVMNAFALPGGVILVTTGMLRQLKTESQLVSVLAHEMGHVELGHCFNAVKVQLTLKKAKLKTLGKIADFAFSVMMRHTFSKTQEEEADAYGFKMLTQTSYHVAGTHQAFDIMLKKHGNYSDQKLNWLRDYFSSHPPLKLRSYKYRVEARKFIKDNSNYYRYGGRKNIRLRIPYTERAYPEEWVRKLEDEAGA